MASSTLVKRGGWPFLITAALGRQPAAMVQLGLLMYVAAVGLGMELAGAVVAAVGLGTATGANIIGRLVDRFGPFPVLVACTVFQVSGLGVILWATSLIVTGQLGHWIMLVAAFFVGTVNPQVGPIARTRWALVSRRLQEPALIRHALGYEGALDEFSFIIGPISASSLVALLGPHTALITLMCVIAVLQLVFASYLFVSRHEWRGSVLATPEGPGKIAFARLIGPMVVLIATGTIFGAMQTSLTTLNDQRGTAYVTGIVYGAVGIGSMVASLVMVRLPMSFTMPWRLMVGSTGVLIVGAGFCQLPMPVMATIMAIFLGLSVGINLVTGFSAAEQVAPSHRIASVMTMMTMCLTLGVSVGAATAGKLAHHVTYSFAVVPAAGACAMLAAGLIMATSRRPG